jgi:hypothetical protein
MDCAGRCSTDSGYCTAGADCIDPYYVDADGDGLGFGTSLGNYCYNDTTIAIGDINHPYVTNDTDLDDSCWSNTIDSDDNCCTSPNIDECGVCSGDNSTCTDCTGLLNGSNVEDNCGTCDSNSDNDCTQDCAGTWGGSLVDDECGICNGGNYAASCADGSCIGTDGMDCAGVCQNGSNAGTYLAEVYQNYWDDIDTDTYGDQYLGWYCTNDVAIQDN